MRGVLFLIAAILPLMGAFAGVREARAGHIVVSNDDWTLHDYAFQQAPDTARFALNVASLFSGGGPGKFHGGPQLGSALADTMTSAGHDWTTGAGISFTLAELEQYDGVFLGGFPVVDFGVLIDYVEAGGNVYLYGGTAQGDILWNPFLNHFGLSFKAEFNEIDGNVAIASPHPLFNGVSSLFQLNGSSIIDLEPSNPRNEILVSQDGEGLFAIVTITAVPEPSTITVGLLGAVIGAAVTRRSRRVVQV